MEIFLIRHADPDYKNDTITPEGHRQALALAESFRSDRPDVLYSSPMGRAIQTQSYLAQMAELTPVILEWLHELDGGCVDGDAAWEHHGHDFLSNGRFSSPQSWWVDHPRFEFLKSSYEKVSQGFDELMRKHGYEKQKNLYKINKPCAAKIALVCHKGTILTLLAYLLHWSLPLIYIHGEIHPTGVTRLLWKENSDGYAVPKLIRLNDTSHLSPLRFEKTSASL